VLADEGRDDEGRQAVGADDEAVDGGGEALFLRDPVVPKWQFAPQPRRERVQRRHYLGKNGGKRQTAKDEVSVVTSNTARTTDWRAEIEVSKLTLPDSSPLDLVRPTPLSCK